MGIFLTKQEGEIQGGDTSISLLAGLHGQSSHAANNYTASNNTNNPSLSQKPSWAAVTYMSGSVLM